MLPTLMNQQRLGKESDESDRPSNNLWVGNLSVDTVDSDLIELFGKFGTLDSVATYSSRSFAFVFFKRVEDAKAAKDALRGAALHGNQIKIEFARPAKPCKSLWVGGISQTISKEELEEEFCKFGKIEDFKFLRDRNTAFVEYFRVEDASQAMRSLNGRRIGGEQIRVDFLRSQPSRREQWPNSHELRDGPYTGRMGPSDSHLAKRPHSQLGGRKGDGQPSKVLWVGYPPSAQIDEQMLHNAMVLFGEIENIKSFPSRHYAFVEFRSVEEARRAKEGLQGRLFNDPRITIMFSSSELAPGKDHSGFYSGIKGPGPDVLLSDHPFRCSRMDMFGQNHTVLPNTVTGPSATSGILRSNVPIRPFNHQGSYDPLLLGPDYDLSAHHNMLDADLKNPTGSNWRKSSPSLPSAQGLRPPTRHISGSWDVYDVSQFQRDAKRSRIEASLPIDDTSFPLRKLDDLGHRADHFGLAIGGGASGPFLNVQGKGRLSPVPGRVTAGGPGRARSNDDYIWRGMIAKGGTPVCHARCVPIGRGIETELPEVVNCSARTGLDMLAKHYCEAIGFDIVFFLPDSEDDFASYTEFLRYLGSKGRAGVAKFDDGTTLFLVPPSEFLTNVLKVAGPERLYGVVLKLPTQVPSITPLQPHPLLSQHDYSLSHLKEEQVMPMEYGRVLHEESIPSVRPLAQSTVQSQPPSNAATLSQSSVALTPDLIASLASFLPTVSQSAAVGVVQPPLVTSTTQSLYTQSIAPKGVSAQSLNEEPQGYDPAASSFQQFNPPAQLPQVQHYSSISSTPIHSSQMALGSTQYLDSAASLPHQTAASLRPLTNFNIPSQRQHGGVPAPVSQQYHPEVPSNTQNGYGMMHGADASGLYGVPPFQQPSNTNYLSNQIHGANVSQPQNLMPSDKQNLQLPNHGQQLQSVVSGAGQGTSDVEADKNQRYQSTLQFAANLLLQIQQQQTNTPGEQGTGSQL